MSMIIRQSSAGARQGFWGWRPSRQAAHPRAMSFPRPTVPSVASPRPQQGGQAAVDGRKPAPDQRHAEKVPGIEPLAEGERPEQDGGNRDQKGDEQQVRRSGRRENA